ncbi:hypothetical protein KY290_005732 [Solanum tuberosum]|uniref:Uncharacterized protein n=1 Tax=Solanum tuberosum TaxID=4113 RepID=A0ABQ7WF04_SOLTU|nr:hypothetical protein KY284_005787 [Solanum tuberosum]KAH0752477.1 hypothetical protein KY285_005625 [Solanum tuberosum]KAH0779305.1 hypothetical protein KY290_005732 [Solanum tuberosum]
MTTAPVSHLNPKVKEKKVEEEEEEEKEKEEEEEKEKDKEKEKKKEKVKKKAKEKEKKVEVVSCDVKQQYPFEGFNIDGESPTELISSFSQWINEVASPKKKDWFYVMSQPNKCWTEEKKLKQQSHSKYRYITTNYFFKTYIDNASVVPEYENKIVGTIKGFGIPAGLP